MSDDEKGYNGWTNYETWCVALWLDNDRYNYQTSRDLVREHAQRDPEYPALAGADVLAAFVNGSMPELEASMWLDMLNAAYARVNFREIAEGILAEEDVDA